MLTDIRMKQISGLMVMEEIKKENPECQFVVLSAYRDFEYAKKACDLGAFAYLLKPIEDEKLQATMTDVGKICEDQIRNEEKYDRWERLLKKDGDGFLQVVVQKYVQNRLPEEKVDEVFHTLQDVMKEGDRFITVYADLDLAYKITNELEYEASRFSMVRMIEEKIAERFTYWKFESEEGHRTFIVKTQENTAVHELKELLEEVKKEENSPVIAAISKPYKGIRGIRRSFEEAQRLFAVTNASGAGVFTIPETVEEKEESPYPAEAEMMVVNSVRKNDAVQLKQACCSGNHKSGRKDLHPAGTGRSQYRKKDNEEDYGTDQNEKIRCDRAGKKDRRRDFTGIPAGRDRDGDLYTGAGYGIESGNDADIDRITHYLCGDRSAGVCIKSLCITDIYPADQTDQ